MRESQADVISLGLFRMKKNLQKFDLSISLWFSSWDNGLTNLTKIKGLLTPDQQRELTILVEKFENSGKNLMTFLRTCRSQILRDR